VRVVVTDADYRLTLGAIRSLGRRGVHVVAVGSNARAIGFSSRYARERVVAPPPSDRERYAARVAEAARGADAILPIGQEATRALLEHREGLPAPAPLPPADSFARAESKVLTLELARDLGVAVPGPADGFPLVAKPAVGSGSVRYVHQASEVPAGWILQEYVAGEGRGFFALFDRGEELAWFMHRRLREYPATGGASTAAESIDDPELHTIGAKLLRELRWHGIAMVEFKRVRDGRYVLMEINPKFWGSLDLAIAAGVDFPWLAVQLALGRPIDAAPVYRVGLRFQWIARDLLHAAARPRHSPRVLRDLFDPRVAKDFTLVDPLPSIIELGSMAKAAVRAARDGTLRYPHGDPGSRPD
jgi:predicted ATP-grasp superfamily ATP-dependent carboligase